MERDIEECRMNRSLRDPTFSTRALVFLCFIAVLTSWAVVELATWAITDAVVWITGSTDMREQQYVGMAMAKIIAVNCVAWALIASGVALLAWCWS